MREKLLQGICWIHGTLILALIVPLLYAIGFSLELQSTGLTYAKSLLIIFPIIISAVAVRKLRSLFTFGLCGIGMICGMGVLMWTVGSIGSQTQIARLCDTVFCMAGTLLIVALRFKDRMNHDRQQKEEDPYWQPKESFLERPGFGALWYFGIIYLLGLGLTSPNVCNEAFYSGMLYVFLIFAYRFIQGTEHYFELNKRVSKLPKKRIYGIGAGVLGSLLICLFLFMIPAMLMASYRPYTDIRDWFVRDETVMEDWELDYQGMQTDSGSGDMDWLLGEQEEAPQIPAWVNAVFEGIAALVLFGVMIVVCRQIRDIFCKFRRSYDENGDRIEELTETEESQYFILEEIAPPLDPQEAQIRRRYKKEIRKRRKEMPGRYESPTELESNAGLQDAQLHALYEAARYAKKVDKHKI